MRFQIPNENAPTLTATIEVTIFMRNTEGKTKSISNLTNIPLPAVPKTDHSKSHIKERERRIEEAKKLSLFSDMFMSVVLKDTAACQHVLRTLTGIRDLKVKRVRTQYRISRLTSRDAVLDVLAEDERGRLLNIEIQQKDVTDHARRVRFYGSLLDSEYLQKGRHFHEVPDIHILFISKTDLWHGNKARYAVNHCLAAPSSSFKTPDTFYDDGIYILYVNAAVDDGSETARMMNYFKTADPEDMSQGALSKRVHYLKCEEGGLRIMCEMTEKWFQEGKREGVREGKREGVREGKRKGSEQKARDVARELHSLGFSPQKIAAVVKVNSGTVKRWISQPVQK